MDDITKAELEQKILERKQKVAELKTQYDEIRTKAELEQKILERKQKVAELKTQYDEIRECLFEERLILGTLKTQLANGYYKEKGS